MTYRLDTKAIQCRIPTDIRDWLDAQATLNHRRPYEHLRYLLEKARRDQIARERAACPEVYDL